MTRSPLSVGCVACLGTRPIGTFECVGHAVGIDLGTTNSVVAAVVDGKVQIIRDSEGNRLHPSIVGFVPNGDVLVGHPAAARRLVDSQNTIYSAKRLIGQRFKNPMVQMAVAAVPYRCEEGENQQAVICLRRGKKLTVPEISGIVLRYLKRCAEIQLGGEVTEAVITVPANFTDSQRQATKLAGQLAGLNVLRVINEPTAAALAYGYGLSLDAKIAVFDLGGGTFDVTVLQVHDKVFEVLSTGGDPFLGGDDFDRALIDRLAHDFLASTRYDAKADPDALSKLRAAAEQIKIRLSTDDAVAGTVHDLAQGVGGTELSLDFDIRRNEFERMITGYVDSAVRKCREVLLASGTQASELTDLILVGGSTRVPFVRRRVAEAFAREPQTKVNPDETVAYGAAIQASSMATAAKTPGRVHALLLDVCPRGLGIKVAGGYNELIIEKNTPVPVERTRTFSTSKDMQDLVTLEVCQGEARQFNENETLGVLSLAGLPPRPRGQCKISVTFTIDADGILAVRAADEDTGAQTMATIRVVGAPTESERKASEPPPIPGGAPPAVGS